MADNKSNNLEEILHQLADNEDEEALRKTYEAYENSLTLLTSASLERVLASLRDTAQMGFLNRTEFAQKLKQAYQRMPKNGTPLDDLRGAIGLVCFTLELLIISEKDIAEKRSQAPSLDWPQELLKDSAVREWLKKVYAPEEQLAEVQSLVEAAVSGQDSNVLYELAPRIAGLPTKEQAVMTTLVKKGMKQASGFSLRAFNKRVKETAAITWQGKPQHVSVTTQNSPIKKQEEEAKAEEAKAKAEENLRLAKEHWKELNLKDPLDPDNPDPLVLYRVGTTSFILRCRINTLAGDPLVLKCLLFPYTQIPDIAEATREYALQYPAGTVPQTARVRSSTDKWILMDFITGPTLQELLEERRKSESQAPRLLRTDLLALIGQPLLKALGSLSSIGKKQHEDLTPSNIILHKRPDGSMEIIFIDLGRNYLYTSHLGLEASREALFVAPEVKNMEGSDTAGLYSFGMILIDLADPIGVQGHTIPDSIYQYVPHLARFIEDLIDKKPKNRLLIFPPTDRKDLYPQLCSIFTDLLQVLPSESEVKPGRFFWVKQFIELFYPSHPLTHLKKLWGITFPSQTHAQIPRYPYARYLYWWLVLSTVCTSLIFTVSLLWGARDFGMSFFDPFVSIAQKLTGCSSSNCLPVLDGLRAPGYVFSITNMQARLVGFSIGLTQSAYYANILAGITARPMKSSTLAHVTELFLRAFTITALPLVLIGNLYQPAWWPVLLLVGYPIPALLNVLCYRLATDTLKKAWGELSTVPPYDPLLKNFGQWGTTLFCYIIVVFLISIGLQNNILHDSWAYAIAAVVINVFILCLSKSIILAPGIRGSLCRAFTLGERLEAVAQNLATKYDLSKDSKGNAMRVICALHQGTFKGATTGGVAASQVYGYGEIDQLMTLAQYLAAHDSANVDGKLSDANVSSYLANALHACGSSPLETCLQTTIPNYHSGNKPTGTPTPHH